MGIKGIDVSAYQSSAPDLTGADFVFVKATEGVSYVNPRMAAQAAHARAAGRVVGFYHFVRAGDMKAQAAYFVNKAASLPGDVLWLDWEDAGVSSAQKDEFLKEVIRLRGATHRVGLYCNTSYWTQRDQSSYYGDALWIAVYNGRPGDPGIKAAWKFHQYTDKPVDTSVSTFATRAELRAWANKAAPAPVPAPAKPAPAPKPSVSLSKLRKAAATDPHAAQGHQTYAAGVRLVEGALRAERLLASKYSGDGSFGSITVKAYADWQRRCGVGGPYDGIPGKASLVKLGAKHGFTVVS
ncbi:glycoside hydrolase family 25 protein [Streptomyces sp. NPDC014864]|uniref:glycoside hydrolase family 25 protein n=1 Tax=Streptomyces sp. NPDC014864 TaxID=3364924 RepID=UPI003700C104